VILRRDRLGRDPLVSALAEREATAAGARIVTADGIANGEEPGDELVRSILDAVARFEARMVAARTRAALAAKRARGGWTGRPPWGHRIGPDGALETLPAAEPTVARIRQLRAEGAGLRRIADALNREGYRRREGDGPGSQWHRGNVAPVVRAIVRSTERV
jgi:DNA invertase Pin-like site-specific DNA recombinase